MIIGDPQGPLKSLRPQAHVEITEYFRSRKGLKLIIVIIPDRTDTTYGEDIVFKNILIYTHILNFMKLFICFRQSQTDYRVIIRYSNTMYKTSDYAKK